ncbi:unnamed protein product, partial [Ixodes hexagonus]
GGFAFHSPGSLSTTAAVMSSPKLKGLGTKKCLRFYYFMPTTMLSERYRALEVSLLDGTNMRTSLWKRSGMSLASSEWVRAETSFNANGSFQVDFKCSISSVLHLGFYCAVDDVRLSDCNRPEGQYRQECDFEQGFCSWRNVKDNFGKFLPWVIGGGTTKSPLRGPTVDHTFGNRTGSYLYVSTHNSVGGTEAHLLSDIVVSEVKTTQCMSFWYIVAGEKTAKLRVKSIPPDVGLDDPKNSLLWAAGVTGYGIWKRGQVAVNGGMRVVISGVIGSPAIEGYIAIDDVVISPNASCDTIPSTPSLNFDVDTLLSCSFRDSSKCKWSSVTRQQNIDWKFGRVDATLSRTGPYLPPPEAKGGDFIFADTSNLGPNQNVLELISPPVPRQEQPLCATFSYHMFAGHGASLSLKLEQPKGQFTSVFQRNGRTTADRWYKVQRTLDVNTDKSKFIFKVENPGLLPVQVALGPFKFTTGACDIVSDSQGWCDFEYDMCKWKADPAWVRELFVPAPSKDFTHSGPEDSLYSLALPVNVPAKSYPLTSPMFQGNADYQCLEFWYRRTNLKVGTLQVDVLPQGSKLAQVLWNQPPYPFDDWMLARVPVLQDKKFQIIFRGNINQGSSATGSLKLDNIVVHPRPCTPVAECSFEGDICGYVNVFTNEFKWLVGTGRVEQPQQVPKLPPRAASDDVWTSFAYLDLSMLDPQYKGKPSTSRDARSVSLLSPIFSSGEGDKIALDFFQDGRDLTFMELSQVSYEENTGDMKTLRTLTLTKAAMWRPAEMPLLPANHTQFWVNVSRGVGNDGMAAVGRIVWKSKQTAWDCDFENNTLCGWQTYVGQLPWKLNDPVKKIPEFPRSDHTLQSFKGHFIYAEHAGSNVTSATLQSPEYPAEGNGSICFSFWYLTIGDWKGTINISSSEGWTVLGADNPGAHHHWSHKQVQFYTYGKPMMFRLKAKVGKGLVAVDDLRITKGKCMESEKCTFERYSPCRFRNSGNAGSWQVTEASKLGIIDHTLQDKAGRVLYLNTTMVMGGQIHAASRAMFGSRQPTTASCLTFWWKGFGVPSDLNVYKYTTETVLRDPIASLRTIQSSWWSVRSVTISSRKEWLPVFEAVSSPMVRQQSGIMLDDVEVTKGECHSEKFCTFEEDICKPWATAALNASRRNEGFHIQRAELFDKLPRDHTLQSGDGYYLLFKSTGDPVDRGSLMLRDKRYQCASLWYFNNGCKILAGNERRTNTTKRWSRVQFDLKSDPVPVGIHVNCGRDKQAFAAIDDLVVDERQCWQLAQSTEVFNCGDKDKRSIPVDRVCDFVKDCENGADEQNCGACDFSSDTCSWNLENSLNNGSLAWRRKRAAEIEDSPSTDRKGSHNGYYLLMHSTDNVQGHAGSAVAVAPTIRNTNYLCSIRFWFNYAAANHTLGAELAMNVSGYRLTAWSLREMAPTPLQKVWKEAHVLIGRYSGNVQIYLSGYEWPMQLGYVAIDSIMYEECRLPKQKKDKCDNSEFRCGNGVCIDKLEVCNFVDQCGDGSDEMNCGDHNLGCNFDTSFCGWEPLVPSGELRGFWQRTPPDMNLFQGPTRDHTTGHLEGSFLKLPAGTQKQDALVAGPTFDSSARCGITFFYIIYGNTPCSLTLNVRSTSNGTLKEVFKASRQTDLFHFVEAVVWLTEEKPYQLFFRGTIEPSGGYNGYIAIDDVSFLPSCRHYPGTLPAAPPSPATTPSPVCPKGLFSCGGTKECIPQSQVCDFKKQCSDGSDEAHCGACDFTQHMCGLTNRDPNSRYVWNRIFTQDVGSGTSSDLPRKDHNNNPQAYYAAYIYANKHVTYTTNGLLTPILGEIAHSCVVSFYAFQTPNWIMTLRFGVELNGTTGVPVLRRKFAEVEGVNKWIRVSVKVGNWNPGYRFYFETNLRSTSIDDITYSNCHPDQRSTEAEAILGVSCDFANSLKCGWFPENIEDDVDWTLYDDGKTARRWHPPQFSSGPGAYMAATSGTTGQKKAHLVSMRIPPTESKTGSCFTFWYNMRHPNSGTLHLLRRAEDNSTELLWTRSCPQGKAWRKGSVVVRSDMSYQLVFEAILPGANPSVIALNHFTFESCNIVKGAVDFETGVDGRWKMSGWAVTKGKSETAPHQDHTTGTGAGSFALLVRSDGDLSTPPLKMGQPRCLKFWHYLLGTKTEQLEIRNGQSPTRPATLWKIDASQAPQGLWLSASVTLNASPTDVIATFAGSKSNSPSAVVAVDDIVIEDGACPPPGSCTFEVDLCNWRNVDSPSDTMQWYQNSGRTSAWNSTVLKDHTTDRKEGTLTYGKYLVLDAEDRSTKKAILESELLHYTSPVCFEFYYHIAMNGDNELSVEFIDTSKSIFSRQEVPSSVSRNWTRFSYEIKNLKTPFTIRITGSPGKLARSDIAIDDILLQTGTCSSEPRQSGKPKNPAPAPLHPWAWPTSPWQSPLGFRGSDQRKDVTGRPSTNSTPETRTTLPSYPKPDPIPVTRNVPACAQGQFNCRNNQNCIPLALLCDGVRDCPNGLDEMCSEYLPL